MTSQLARKIDLLKPNTTFDRRQMPVEESGIKMVLQFDQWGGCEGLVKQTALDKFIDKCAYLDNTELSIALLVPKKEVLKQLEQSITCIGCRRSVEGLFEETRKSRLPILEPLIVTPHAELSIKADIVEPRALYCLFNVHGCWSNIWNMMDDESQKSVLTIPYSSFEETLSTYLTKHRFCPECRNKVILVYNILIGVHPYKEEGYREQLFDRLCPCSHDGYGHLHVRFDDAYRYVNTLISMAEPEISNLSDQDRHAKTLDIAQEEVLTCIGVYIYERLHKIHQKVRQVEQTWHLLFSLGVETLRKSFESAIEQKQGVSNLERVCDEIEMEERLKEQKRELKRLKKKKKRKKALTKMCHEDEAHRQYNGESSCHCMCMSVSAKPLHLSNDMQCDKCLKQTSSSDGVNSLVTVTDGVNRQPGSMAPLSVQCHRASPDRCFSSPPGWCCDRQCGKEPALCSADCGYSSEHDGADTSSCPGSLEGSEEVCSDGVCLHPGDITELSCLRCEEQKSPQKIYHLCPDHVDHVNVGERGLASHDCQGVRPVKTATGEGGSARSLVDMLEASLSCGDDEVDGVFQEEIRHYKANKVYYDEKRQRLRKRLRERFQTMRQHGIGPHHSTPCSQFSSSPALLTTPPL